MTFTISSAQADLLARDVLVLRACAFLREQPLPRSDALSDADLREQVAAVTGRAAQHGVETERGVLQWVWLSFACGGDFPGEPARTFLQRPEATPDQLLDVLFEQLAEHLNGG
jgi:hypothetical protein